MHKKETNKIVDIKDTNEQKTDSMILQLPSDTNSIKPRIKGKYTLSDIQGAWGENLDGNAYFLIEGDSALYIEGEIIPIAVSNDSLIFYYPDSPMSFKINWIRGDSMSLRMYDKSEILIRRNK
jgi:hypothetical protein